MRISETPDRLVIRVPNDAHHLDPTSKFYSPEQSWLGIEWVNSSLTVHLMTYEESDRWLRGEEFTKDNA